MGEARCFSLADAVQMTLAMEGVNVLNNAPQFLGFLMDFMGSTTAELRVLERCCNKELLAPYAQTLQKFVPDLQLASSQAFIYLTTQYFIREDVARSVCEGVAEGVARWRGIAWEPAAGSAADATQGDTSSQGRGSNKVADKVAPTAGIFVDAKGLLHVSALITSASSGQHRLVHEITEWGGLRECFSRVLGKRPTKPVSALVAASDLNRSRYVGLNDLFCDAGINVKRWHLPTDALCFGLNVMGKLQGDCYCLVAHLSARLCTLGLYDCTDGVIECLCTERSDVGTDIFRRDSVVSDLVARLDDDSEGQLSFIAEQNSALYITVVDELGHQDGVAATIRAALMNTGCGLTRLARIAAGPADIACGLAALGGVVTGDINGFLLLASLWFDILLEGTRGDMLHTMRNTTIPTSHTVLLENPNKNADDKSDLGLLTAIVIAMGNGRGLRFPLPSSWTGPMSAEEFYPAEATVDVFADHSTSFTLRSQATGKQCQCRLNDLMSEATEVFVTRPSESSNA